MTLTSSHVVYVDFLLPDDVYVGGPGYRVAGEKPHYYLRATSKKSADDAIAKAHQAAEAISRAVEENGRE